MDYSKLTPIQLSLQILLKLLCLRFTELYDLINNANSLSDTLTITHLYRDNYRVSITIAVINFSCMK